MIRKEKIGSSKAKGYIDGFLLSGYFPFALAAVTLACYYSGWEMVTIWTVGLCMLYMLLFMDDLTPMAALFLIMNVMISKEHSPSYTVGSSDFFFRTAVIVQLAVLISVLVAAVFYRIIRNAKEGKIKLTPAFGGLCALAVCFLLNGLGSEDYTLMDTVYGVFMAFFFLAVFVLLKDNLATDPSAFRRVALSFMALSALLVTELSVAYLTTENLITDGSVNRSLLMYGWGVHNTMGMLLVICIPAAFYLASVYRYGWLLTVYGFALCACAFLSMSRQAMIGAAVITPASIIYLIVRTKGSARLINLAVTAAAVAVCAVLLYVFRTQFYDNIVKLLRNLFTADGTPNGSGRWALWNTALENYLENPLFGAGWYVQLAQAAEMVGLDIIPLMYHNTFMQLLGSCGTFALLAYMLHRTQTVISYAKNPSKERTYIAFTVLALLIMNLFDNHLFYILPTLVYSFMISLLIKSEKNTAQ